MLAKKFRLPIQLFVGKSAKTAKVPYFLLKIFSKTTDKGAFSRFGVIISSKVSKKSVDRNRIRRVAMEFFRLNKERLPIADYLLIIHPSVNTLDRQGIINQLSRLLKLTPNT